MMDRSQLLSLGVAALCMVAIGVSATTLEGTVSTKPDDVIDLDYESLPIGQDSAADIDREIESNSKNPGDTSTAPADSSQSNTEREVQTAGDEAQSQQLDDTGQGLGPVKAPQSLLDKTLELLAAVLPYLVAAASLAFVGWAAYSYRDKIAAFALLPFAEDGPSGPVAEQRDPWEDVDVPDGVHRAWYTMVRALDMEDPWSRTPAECRERAIEAGLDPEAVSTITETFREVRYTERPPSGKLERRARDSVDRLDLGRNLV